MALQPRENAILALSDGTIDATVAVLGLKIVSLTKLGRSVSTTMLPLSAAPLRASRQNNFIGRYVDEKDIIICSKNRLTYLLPA